MKMCDTNKFVNIEGNQIVYGFSNPSYKDDIIKIGWTDQNPISRGNDLYKTGVPSPFEIEFVIPTTNGFELEKYIHKHINQYRLNKDREFFKIQLNKLKEILTNELHLTIITDKNEICNLPYTQTIQNKRLHKIEQNLKILQNLANEFLSKLKQDHTTYIITQNKNGAKIVSAILLKPDDPIYNININPKSVLVYGSDDFYEDERHIEKKCDSIELDIKLYEDMFVNLRNNYKDIKNTIGSEQLKIDNHAFLKQISDTLKELIDLKREYIWQV